MIKGILFDYGGTIDTNGIHWAEVIWEHYQKYKLPVSKQQFLDAYRHGERALATQRIVEPFHRFYDVMVFKIAYQFEWLFDKGIDLSRADGVAIAEDCSYFAEYTVQRSASVLQQLAQSFPLAIVSNFYGNISTVLTEFGIADIFRSVVESAVAGVRKPDPEIYRLGVKSLGLSPETCVVVGDSFSKDIVPAKIIGCQTIWLNGVPFDGEDEAAPKLYRSDQIISDLQEVGNAIDELSGILKS